MGPWHEGPCACTRGPHLGTVVNAGPTLARPERDALRAPADRIDWAPDRRVSG
jgi:hypothetical protein